MLQADRLQFDRDSQMKLQIVNPLLDTRVAYCSTISKLTLDSVIILVRI
jgi:hypothetical protein